MRVDPFLGHGYPGDFGFAREPVLGVQAGVVDVTQAVCPGQALFDEIPHFPQDIGFGIAIDVRQFVAHVSNLRHRAESADSAQQQEQDGGETPPEGMLHDLGPGSSG